jgi:hypothetical protein
VQERTIYTAINLVPSTLRHKRGRDYVSVQAPPITVARCPPTQRFGAMGKGSRAMDGRESARSRASLQPITLPIIMRSRLQRRKC